MSRSLAYLIFCLLLRDADAQAMSNPWYPSYTGSPSGCPCVYNNNTSSSSRSKFSMKH